jgi:hypothetical protein
VKSNSKVKAVNILIEKPIEIKIADSKSIAPDSNSKRTPTPIEIPDQHKIEIQEKSPKSIKSCCGVKDVCIIY